ncbi:MAG: homoserine kinase [Actinomycetaceae bacterium]|nr:homoserine kinase [Actinomycetaceae bacterium]
MQIKKDSVQVQVPATSANLGPGFDCLGMALDLRDMVWARATAGRTHVEVNGAGQNTVPTDEDNLVVKAIRVGLTHVGAPQVGLQLKCENSIPHGRGLGSSATAIISGLMVARAFIGEDDALDLDTILQLATQMEGHPDNVSPALYGGVTVSWQSDRARSIRLPLMQELTTTAFIPPKPVSTTKARALLPQTVPHVDAAFNAGRAAVLVATFLNGGENFFDATADRLHQDYRTAAMPESVGLMHSLRHQGYPAVISGAGPTVLVLGKVKSVICRQARERGWDVRQLKLQTEGARIIQ